MCAGGPLYPRDVTVAQRCVSVPCVSCCSSCGHELTHKDEEEMKVVGELELRSIRATTYLQTVGESCLSVTHQPSGTLALLTPGPPLPTAQLRAREGKNRGRREMTGCGQNEKHTHACWQYMCERPHKQIHMCAYKHLHKLNELI